MSYFSFSSFFFFLTKRHETSRTLLQQSLTGSYTWLRGSVPFGGPKKIVAWRTVAVQLHQEPQSPAINGVLSLGWWLWKCYRLVLSSSLHFSILTKCVFIVLAVVKLPVPCRCQDIMLICFFIDRMLAQYFSPHQENMPCFLTCRLFLFYLSGYYCSLSLSREWIYWPAVAAPILLLSKEFECCFSDN